MLADRVKRDKAVTAATLGLLGTSGAVSPLSERLRADANQIQSPLLFLMQLEDELFPRDGCLDLFDHFSSENKTLHANPGLHPEIPGFEVRNTIEFIADHLLSD